MGWQRAHLHSTLEPPLKTAVDREFQVEVSAADAESPFG